MAISQLVLLLCIFEGIRTCGNAIGVLVTVQQLFERWWQFVSFHTQPNHEILFAHHWRSRASSESLAHRYVLQHFYGAFVLCSLSLHLVGLFVRHARLEQIYQTRGTCENFGIP